MRMFAGRQSRITKPTDRRASWRMLVPGLLCAVVLIVLMASPLQKTPTSQEPSWQGSAVGSGRGAGGAATSVQIPSAPKAFCLPTDTGCLLNNTATWIASQIQAAFQPLADQILTNPADIVYQTPLLTDETSPQNRVILTLNMFFVEVVDLGFASLLVIGGYNVIVGRHLGLPASGLQELLPRAVLVEMAVHFNVLFLGLFIQFENALTLAVIHVAGLTVLTHLIVGLFTLRPTSVIFFVLLVVLGVMILLLLLQMVTRLGLVALSLALAPLGLACFLLPQSLHWGRLWLSTLASSVLVQFVQVVALSLGGIFITALATTSLLRLDHDLALVFLAIGTLGLVLKIPGMLQHWALRPMMNAHQGQPGDLASADAGSGSAGTTGSSTLGETAASGGGGAVEGTIVTEESGALLLLF